MTSVDSGVETENDSNDSLATHDSQSMDLSPSIRVNLEVVFDNKEPVPSTSGEAASDNAIPFGGASSSSSDAPSTSTDAQCSFKECPTNDEDSSDSGRILEFRLPAAKVNNATHDIDPPAGISFINIKQSVDSSIGYEVISQSYPSAVTMKTFKCYSNYNIQNSKRYIRRRKQIYRSYFPDPLSKYSEKRLRQAVSTNNCELVSRLLDSGVDPNSSDELKRSPLHLAACRGYNEILQMLLQSGADPNQKDSMGNTPLHLAACTNHVSVVTLLLRAGTDVHSSDHFGRSPLQLAQTRLRLLQRSAANNPDAWQVKTEVQKVIEMMLVYLNRYGAGEADAELLSSFSSRLTLTQTSQEVDQELRGLLASLNSLTIDKPSTS